MDINKLILKALDKTASLEEYQTLEAWKQESDANLEFLKSMQENFKNPDYKDFDKESAWNSINSKLDVNQTKTTLWPWVIAAIIICGLAIATYVYLAPDKVKNIFQSDDKVEYFALKDNSKIWLNKNSEVAYLSDFTSERKVSLSGEAFFDVESDKSNPFIISINETDYIKVVGTSFNVINSAEAFDLAVYSGHVELHTLNRVIDLYKNDRIVKINGAFAKIQNNSNNLLSWKNKELVFDNVTLSKAFEDLSDHYAVEFKFDKSINLNDCKLRSRYNQETIGEVLKELKSFFDIEYSIDNKSVLITKLNCN